MSFRYSATRTLLLLALGYVATVTPREAAYAQDARYIVRFKSVGAVSKRDLQVLNKAASGLGDLGLQDIDRIPHDNAIVVRMRSDDAITAASRPDVEAVEVDAPVYALRETSDPLLSEQYSLGSIGGSRVKDAWDVTTGSSRAIVAVIDTGVDLKHPDLRDNMWRNKKEIAGNRYDDDGSGCVDDLYGCDLVNKDGSPQDDNGHGTHVAGIVAALGDNATGVAGVAWGTKVVAVKALDSQGSGFVSTIVRAIDYVTDLKRRGVAVSIINLSLGGGAYSDALLRAVERARNHDLLTVAAAGNEGSNNDLSPLYPANLPLDSVVSVAATNGDANLASFSNYGATSVHIAAPGSVIVSTALQRSGFSYRTMSGTSMACPHISGVLALIAAANPQLSMLQVRNVLLSSGVSLSALQNYVRDGTFVDALDAVRLAQVTQGLPRVYGYVRRGTQGIRNATVTLTSLDDPSNVRSVQTSKDGSYSFSEVSLGRYALRAIKPGRRFRSASVSLTKPGVVRKIFLSSR
jgi:subtilisin family serine protease